MLAKTTKKNFMSITQSPIWKSLQAHFNNISGVHMRDLFNADPARFKNFSLATPELLLDYSKNRINKETLLLLCQLAEITHLDEKISALFKGKIVNSSEQRAALHTALRAKTQIPLMVDGKNIRDELRGNEKKLQEITTAILQQQWLGFTDQPITDIVNIGIGGSELGPAMVTTALQPYAVKLLRCHFVSNIDGSHIDPILKNLNPATTLFIVSSKYFSTQETLVNAETAKRWLLKAAQNPQAMQKHFIAITAKSDRAQAFGITAENILPLWDWIGGRFSLWSAVGLPIALTLGFNNFQSLLAGAQAMDEHFRTAPFHKNMPVILGLLSIWYTNFFQVHSRAIIPYEQNLQLLPTYLQQLHMESLGKQVCHNGNKVDYSTGPVIWGGVGTNGQHTFHQLLHQGTQLIPVDFIIALQHHHEFSHHHDALFANCLSQSHTLMMGKTYEEIYAELIASGVAITAAKLLAAHKTVPGNRPSNTILLSKLTPYTLGALIALYEHKIFTQSVIWDINGFDQWGVELGKQLATTILQDLPNKQVFKKYDSSTCGLIDYYRSINLTKKLEEESTLFTGSNV